MAANASSAQIAIAARSVRADIRLPLDEMDLLLRLDRDLDGGVSGAELDAARAGVDAYLVKHVRIVADGRPLPLLVGALAVRRDRDGAYIEAQTRSEPASRIGSIAISSDLLSELEPGHRTEAEIRVGERTEAFVFQPGVTYQRRVGADWETAGLLLAAAALVIGALWFARRRRAAILPALTAAVMLAASVASADVILSAAGLNAALKGLERLKRQAQADATFTLGVEAGALAALMTQEVESHGMQERALLDLALSRTKELGIAIVYNREKKRFFYDGAAFAEYLRAAPRGPHAADASFALLSVQFYQLPATDSGALTVAVDATRRFLAGYPAHAANVEARLFLAVDYRDLYRLYQAADDAVSAAKYRELARETCRRLVSRYPRTEQAEAARQLLRGLGEPP